MGIEVVIEKIQEPGDTVGGDYDGGPSSRRLLRDLEVPTPGILLQIEVEQLVLHLKCLTQQLDVIPSSSAAAAAARIAFHSPESTTAEQSVFQKKQTNLDGGETMDDLNWR